MSGALVFTVVATMLAVAAVPVLVLWWATSTIARSQPRVGQLTITITADTSRFQAAIASAAEAAHRYHAFGSTAVTASAQFEQTMDRFTELFSDAKYSPVESMPLTQFLAEVRPGSHGETWTWTQEYEELIRVENARMAALTASIDDVGQLLPVLVGTDGWLWDGHHRVCALMTLGLPVLLRRWLPGDEEPTDG